MAHHFIAVLLSLVAYSQCESHRTQDIHCISQLPGFKDQGLNSPMLLIGIQALVPAYQITCNGTLVQWRVATVRGGQHSVHLQVWRPVQEAGSYRIVGENSFNIKPQGTHNLFSLIPSKKDLIGVQEGDILGFYLENNASIGDDFSIQYQANTPGIEASDSTINPPTTKTATSDSDNTSITKDTDKPTGYHTTTDYSNPTTEDENNDLFVIISSVLAAVLGVTCLLLTTAVLFRACMATENNRKESTDAYIEEDYECRRAVIIPPPPFRKHTDMMIIAVTVPLWSNLIHEQIPRSSAHEYETPILLSPERSQLTSIG
ncbi:uncharacterized protein LOC135350959 isoform X2 [Halichondria panicea]|uniref:uncharacterized protein LOC135350959 isoform X2 n=1 Tax=Halichondria panicea TaxID=6063 RepID=UPI00312B666A